MKLPSAQVYGDSQPLFEIGDLIREMQVYSTRLIWALLCVASNRAVGLGGR
jgi:hypothetical protein